MCIRDRDTGVDMGHEIFKTAPKSPSLTREKLQSTLEQYDFQVEQIIREMCIRDSAHVGDIPGDLLGPQLGVAGVDLILLDVDGGIHILTDHALVEENGVLVVVTFPGHEANQDVPAQGDLALIGGRTVGQDRGILPLALLILAQAVDTLCLLYTSLISCRTHKRPGP